MLEVEAKFPRPAELDLPAALAALGCTSTPAQNEVDEYFNAPHRDFAQTDEAVRLRQVGATNILTYKGPKQGTVGKTRTEIEVPLEAGATAAENLRRLLLALGFRPTLTVRKRRECWRPGPASPLTRELTITLDEVEGLGQYVELERLTEPAQADAVQNELQALARQLGLGAEERRSYLEMLLARTAKAGPA